MREIFRPRIGLSSFASRREAGRGVAEDLAVLDAEGFDPALLAQGKGDEKSQLDQLGNGEMLIEFLPKSIIGDVGIPGNGAGIGERDFLALGEFIRISEVE